MPHWPARTNPARSGADASGKGMSSKPSASGRPELRRWPLPLDVGALHQAGRHDTTEATRWASRYIDRPFTILGLS